MQGDGDGTNLTTASAPLSAASLRTQSLHRLQQLPRLTQQIPNLLALRNRVPREQAVPPRVLVSLLTSGSLRAAVHAAAFLAAHRLRAARSSGAGSCSATRAGLHGADIAGVTAHAGLLLATITLACCVTLPTIALPPSATDTFCTVMAGSPRQRWRLSASIWAGKVRASRPRARAAL